MPVRHSVRSGSRTGTSSSSQNGAGRGRFGKIGVVVVSLGQLEREWPWVLCWVPEIGRSPVLSSLVGGISLRDKRPPPAHHQNEEGAFWSSFLTRRPLRMRWYEVWRAEIGRAADRGVRVGGRWHKTTESTSLSALSGGRTFWWQPVAIFRALF